MSEMQKKKKMGDHDFASEIKRVEHCPDFDKLYVIQYGIQGLQLKISKVSQQKQTILL